MAKTSAVKRCQHDTVYWKDYYGAHYRMCRSCDLLEVEVAIPLNKGYRWIPVDRVTQHDASAMWKALQVSAASTTVRPR